MLVRVATNSCYLPIGVTLEAHSQSRDTSESQGCVITFLCASFSTSTSSKIRSFATTDENYWQKMSLTNFFECYREMRK
uniref:AlNc14C446G11700 protein n=1 Tax=Albugo laibachii Nc14 TaxID=890382 RepID=F0WZV9_9STRA|nr:AlNc14C446G11700 [Albugo laibachii Nc14]|eukprot:CCA27038.1 AlNc14C446G11700 [Albugo laibachii Nc14]